MKLRVFSLLLVTLCPTADGLDNGMALTPRKGFHHQQRSEKEFLVFGPFLFYNEQSRSGALIETRVPFVCTILNDTIYRGQINIVLLLARKVSRRFKTLDLPVNNEVLWM